MKPADIENEHLIAIHKQGSPAVGTIIMFSAVLAGPNEHEHLKHGFFSKWAGDVVAIIPRTKGYFPPAAMADVILKYRNLRCPVIAYGSSMGGYAALRYSRALNANAVLAFAPQYSISPHEAPFDPIRHTYYDPALHGDMAISKDDLVGKVFVFFDPWENIDTAHAAAIAKAGGEKVSMIRVHHVGHHVITVALHSRKIAMMVKKVLCHSSTTMATFFRHEKKATPAYIRGVSLALSRSGRKATALAVLDAGLQEGLLAPPLLQARALILHEHGEDAAALRTIRELLDNEEFYQSYTLGDLSAAATLAANINQLNGNQGAAIYAFRQAVAIETQIPRLHLDLIHSLVGYDLHEEALVAARIAAELFPHLPDLNTLIRNLDSSAPV